MDNCLSSEDTKGIAVQEEASIVNAARSDPLVFKQLYLAHVRSVYRYIYSKLGDVKQAEDITAQVFLEALESLPRYRHQGYFAAWLFGIARHKVADHYRSQHMELPFEVAQRESSLKDDPISTVIQTEETQRISDLIHQLDEPDQELLRLRFVAELGFAEIAQLVNSNMEATKKRFYRLMAHLRQHVELEHE